MSKKKRAIMAAAIRLFSQRGYSATPVSVIAKEADVAEGTIFRHFANKEDLFLQIIREIRQGFFDALEQESRFSEMENGMEMVLSLIRFHCRFYRMREIEFDLIHRNNPYQMPHVGEPCWDEVKRMYDRMLDLLKTGIRFGITDGSIRKVDMERTALMIQGMLTGMVRMRLFENIRMDEVEEDVVQFCRSSLEPVSGNP